jgi:hypothetical protein
MSQPAGCCFSQRRDPAGDSIEVDRTLAGGDVLNEYKHPRIAISDVKAGYIFVADGGKKVDTCERFEYFFVRRELTRVA